MGAFVRLAVLCWVTLIAAGMVFCGLIPHAGAQDLERGFYLARIMDCGGCHTPGALAGQPDEKAALSGGGVGFAIPNLGVFYPPNLTPDIATGLGAWTEADIIRAIREGIRPDGRELAPVMPWKSYAALNDQDAADLAAYLKSLAAAVNPTPGPFASSQTPDAPYLSMVMPGKN